MLVSKAAVEQIATRRGDAFLWAVLKHGQVDGSNIEISERDFVALLDQHQSSQDPNLPPVTRQFVNAMGALARTAGQVVTGRPVYAPDAVAEQRLAVCKACEHFRVGDSRCSKCGCFMASGVVKKTSMAAEKCPDQPPRWGAFEPV